MTDHPIHASCHCGAVLLAIEVAPTEITDCNCSICRRYGVLWAYYEPRQVKVEGVTETYLWDDRCGCVSHWSSVDPARQRMGVNARLMDLDVRS